MSTFTIIGPDGKLQLVTVTDVSGVGIGPFSSVSTAVTFVAASSPQLPISYQGPTISVPAPSPILIGSWPGINPSYTNYPVPINDTPVNYFTRVDLNSSSGFQAGGFAVWGTAVIAGTMTFPVSGVYEFRFTAALVLPLTGSAWEGLVIIHLDQVALDTGNGRGEVWSAANAADTVTLTTGIGVINSGQWSVPVYTAKPDDPLLLTWSNTDTIYAPSSSVDIRMPLGMTVASPIVGGDHTILLFDSTSTNRWMYSGFNATIRYPRLHHHKRQRRFSDGISLGRCQIHDQFNGFNHGTGQGSGQNPGLIRTWEITAGSIQHMCLLGLATNMVLTLATPWTNLGWPAWEADYNGAFGLYTGNIQYGSTIGIPSTVNISTLGLTASGYVLARCL